MIDRELLQERRMHSFEVKTRALEDGSDEMIVEGYAAVFDSPTVLFEYNGVEYKEQICRGAFDKCKMDDVIFNYNHEGKVLARTRNHTLELEIDEKGLKVRAKLGGTEEGRKLYDEIKGGYVDRMSFAFRTEEESFNETETMWNVRSIKRLYDVSAVSIPAYDDTMISARRNSILEAEAQEKKRIAAEAALAERRSNLIKRLTV